MIPIVPVSPYLLLGVPRVGGGDPAVVRTNNGLIKCSPRRRG